jgi:GT2 family glycosyltransferase
MVRAAESNPRIGVAGPLVYHFDEPSVIQSAGGLLSRNWEPVHLGQNEEDCGQFRETHPVDWISGCGILIRLETIQQVGTIDERYFYFWEELEWCIRAKEAGWQIVHVPFARMWHKGVQRNYRPKPTVTYYATRNRLLTLAKHGAPVRARIVAWLQITRTLASWTLKPKWRSWRSHRNAMWRGMVDFLCSRWGGPVEL